MSRQIFVNLPVKDLPRAQAFFSALGYRFDPQFTDQNAACLVLGDNIFAMLLTEPFFRGFTSKAICDAHQATEALLCLSFDSREEVDALVTKAVAAGAKETRKPEDHGFMYQRSFADLDGHQWEFIHMSGPPA
jgi:predicted lactoylglutathione lyase